VGESAKGTEFKTLARIIDPAMDPATIKDTALPSAAELLASGRAASIGGGASSVPAASLSSFFLRYVSALLDESSAEVLPFLDGSLYVSKVPVEVKNADARPAFDAFFARAPLSGKKAGEIFDLESMVIARAPQAMQDAWGETYTLTVNARADFSAAIVFWEPRQQYFVHRTAAGWRIFGVGQSAPPLTWRPAVAAAAPMTTAAAPQADPTAAVSDSFKEFLSAILGEDADAAMAQTGATVRFLRLRQTVTKDELKTTMLGVFDRAQFPSTLTSDVVDLASVFVQPADSPVEGVGGPVYVLNVKSTADLSADIPFWAAYMQFYFAAEGSSWVIFAIM